MAYETVTYRDLQVRYLEELDGGGRTFGQSYLDFIGRLLGPVDRAFEWCCGPAFIGFSLLASGLCRELDLADVNDQAVRAVRATIMANDLDGRVSVYTCDNLNGIPPERTWDLVVGNPPHSGTDQTYPESGKLPIIYMDQDWRLHREFYSTVGKHLRPGGRVIIQENSEFSGPEDFREMIEAAGLVIKRVDDAGGKYYFIWSEQG